MTDTNEADLSNSRYGALAFAVVVVACYAGYFTTNVFFGPPSRVVLTFLLGAVYVAVSMLLGRPLVQRGGAAKHLYFAFQCALLTAIVWLSPLRGFYSIIV